MGSLSSDHSRIIKAPKSKVWKVISDLEKWPTWATDFKNGYIEHRIIDRFDNVFICVELELIAGIYKSRHIDRYALYPEEKLEEKILDGDFLGTMEMNLSDHPEGTLLNVKTTVEPQRLILKIVNRLYGQKLLDNYWKEVLDNIESKVLEQSND